jgi:ABC-type multidrug transport system fused ATPase/permease subunit
MFNTSGDVLNLVLSVCLVVLTVFICLALYYFIASIQKIHNLIRRAEDGVTKVEEVIEIAREKLKNSAAYFMILGEIAKKAMDFVQEKREKKAARKKK